MKYIEEKPFLTRGKAILFGIILITIIVLLFIFFNKGKSYNKNYINFEKEIETAAENYVIINDISLKIGEEKRVSLKELDNNNLLFNKLRKKCKGYVVIYNEKNKATNEYKLIYNGYISCDGYRTVNYSEY